MPVWYVKLWTGVLKIWGRVGRSGKISWVYLSDPKGRSPRYYKRKLYFHTLQLFLHYQSSLYPRMTRYIDNRIIWPTWWGGCGPSNSVKWSCYHYLLLSPLTTVTTYRAEVLPQQWVLILNRWVFSFDTRCPRPPDLKYILTIFLMKQIV